MQAATVERLSQAIGNATRSAHFCVGGCLPDVDPGLEIENLGSVVLPLKRVAAKELISHCQIAPYGKGTQTLIDRKVRNTYEIDADKFRLNSEWNAAIDAVTKQAAAALGLPGDQVKAEPYKLLVYEKGGFFLPHRDSEKLDRMVASLIVALPNRFDGGALVVTHGAVQETFRFSEAANAQAACYAAFYADCEHEVQRVMGGVRVCLAYNLVLQGKRPRHTGAISSSPPADVLAASINSWTVSQPDEPLVFALEHQYTQRGLAIDLLKGADRELAELVIAAAEQADCVTYLCQVTRHLQQYADDGSFDHGYSRYRAHQRAIEIGETYEDELYGTEWADLGGKKQSWRELAFQVSAIVASVPLDEWKPTTEDYERYTGNAGNRLDRWYHRSAIVIWRRDRHFNVIAKLTPSHSIPLFCSMAGKLARTPKKKLEAFRTDCVRFARAIIHRWPISLGYYVSPDQSLGGRFSDQLLSLHDRETVALFLSVIAERDQNQPLATLVVNACREFGWTTFASELKTLIGPSVVQPSNRELRQRDIEWLSSFCCDKATDAGKTALGDALCEIAVNRFCEPRQSQRAFRFNPNSKEQSLAEQSLPLLIKALVALGRDSDLARVIQFVQSLPDVFHLGRCQVPCLMTVIPWSRKQIGAVHPELARWLQSVRQYLTEVTAQRPTPPDTWARPNQMRCSCRQCTELKAFLADAENKVGRIAAAEMMRQHLIQEIRQNGYDVDHTLERKGSPYSLVLTKTTGSYARSLKQFEEDERLLAKVLKLG